MNALQRGIVSGIICTASVVALLADWLMNVDIPVWLWFTWLALVAAWGMWSISVDRREVRDFQNRIDRYLDGLLGLGEEMIVSGVRLRVHSIDQCRGEICCVHNPSDHNMRVWPQNWRGDIGIMERVCSHGIGHPDPDDHAYRRRVGLRDMSIHDCDACCMEEEK